MVPHLGRQDPPPSATVEKRIKKNWGVCGIPNFGRPFSGAYGAPNCFKNFSCAMRIPNMCLVLKLNNGKVVSIAVEQPDIYLMKVIGQTQIKYVGTMNKSHSEPTNAYFKRMIMYVLHKEPIMFFLQRVDIGSICNKYNRFKLDKMCRYNLYKSQ